MIGFLWVFLYFHLDFYGELKLMVREIRNAFSSINGGHFFPSILKDPLQIEDLRHFLIDFWWVSLYVGKAHDELKVMVREIISAFFLGLDNGWLMPTTFSMGLLGELLLSRR